MNGRVYNPLLGRFGTPDPMTESPYSTQGWNRYSYVGNSPVNFTDPSGYCFMGCFWKPAFAAIGKFFNQNLPAIIQGAATALLCSGPLAPVCAGIISATVTGVTSGDLGMALRAGLTSLATAFAMDFVGTATLGAAHTPPDFLSPKHLANMAGHALVGCASAVMGGGRCGPGALSAAAGSFAGPLLRGLGRHRNLVSHAVVGGLASVAGGGNFANGAVTAAFGYLFNDVCILSDCIADGYAQASAGKATLDDAISKVPVTYYGGVGIEEAIGIGAHGSVGVAVEGNTGDWRAFYSYGASSGFTLGTPGAFIGIIFGNLAEFQAYDLGAGFDSPEGGATINFKDFKPVGMQYNFRAALPGWSTTTVNTCFPTLKSLC